MSIIASALSVGPDGPLLLQDHYLIEQMANFNRERIPERQPHACGVGARIIGGRPAVTQLSQVDLVHTAPGLLHQPSAPGTRTA